jgi:hypothetical protein
MNYWHYEDLDRSRSPGYSQYGGKDVLDFDGGRDPYAFQDWLDALEDYLEWIGAPPNRKVRFVKMMLKNEARIWWRSVEEYHHHLCLPPISDWGVMKIKLQEKYGAKHYFQDPQPPTRKQPTQIHKPSPPLCDNVPPKRPIFSQSKRFHG